VVLVQPGAKRILCNSQSKKSANLLKVSPRARDAHTLPTLGVLQQNTVVFDIRICPNFNVTGNYCSFLPGTRGPPLHSGPPDFALPARRIAAPLTGVRHTHAHPFNGPLSGTTRVSRYQKGKTNLDFTEARDSEWQWHQLDHTQVCTSLQTDNHANTPTTQFLQAGCPVVYC